MELLKIIFGGLAFLVVCVQSSPFATQSTAIVALSSIQEASNTTTCNNGTSLSKRLKRYVAIGQKVAASVSAQQWEVYVNKGCNLIGAMSGTDKAAAEWLRLKDTAESQFKAYSDLAVWGYEDEPFAQKDFRSPGGGPALHDALKHYGLNEKKAHEEGGLNVCIAAEHTKPTKHGEVVYPKTGARFRTVINVDEGVIVGWYKFGAKHKGLEQTPPVKVLPKLQRWSDIAFVKWKYLAEQRKKDVSNIRFIFSAQVENSATAGVVARVLTDDPGKQYVDGENPAFSPSHDCDDIYWENRKQFTMDQPQGKALLATPNGIGAAYFLIQHKSTFGEKTSINAVTMWCDEDTDQLNLMFHVNKEPIKAPEPVIDPNKQPNKSADSKRI